MANNNQSASTKLTPRFALLIFVLILGALFIFMLALFSAPLVNLAIAAIFLIAAGAVKRHLPAADEYVVNRVMGVFIPLLIMAGAAMSILLSDAKFISPALAMYSGKRVGVVTLSSPSPMISGRSGRVEAILSGIDTALAAALEVKPQSGDQTHSLQILPRMRATLRGTQFQTLALTPEITAVSGHRALWAWEVTPLSAGMHSLTLTVSGIKRVEGSDTDIGVEVFSKDIVVSTDWVERGRSLLAPNLPWVWSAVVVPAFGMLYFRLRKPKAWKPW